MSEPEPSGDLLAYASMEGDLLSAPPGIPPGIWVIWGWKTEWS